MDKIFLILIIIFCTSCDERVVFEEYYDFQKNVWHTDSLIKFEYFIEDTLSSYDLFLKVRHSIGYEFQNLFLFTQSESEKDTIQLIITNKKGKWTGKGIGDIREVETKMSKKYFHSGKKFLYIEQAMRYGSEEKINNLKNINAIGLVISKTNE